MNIGNIFGCHHCLKKISFQNFTSHFSFQKIRRVSILKCSVEPHKTQNRVICTNVRLKKVIGTYANTRSTLKPYWNLKPYTICPKCICKQLREMNKLILKSNQMTTFFPNLRERLLWAPLQKLFRSISNEERRLFEMFRCVCFFCLQSNYWLELLWKCWE